MPDMPQGGPPPSAGPAPGGAPPQGGPPPDQGGGGGGIGDAIIQVDQTLNKITQAVTQNPKLPDEIKKGFSDALTAFRGASQALVQAAGGGGNEPDGDEGGGAVSPQAGGSSGAVPMTHAPMKGG